LVGLSYIDQDLRQIK